MFNCEKRQSPKLPESELRDSFFEQHHADIIRLFKLADIDKELPPDITKPMVLHDYAKTRWMIGDHWAPDSRYANTVAPEDLTEFNEIIDRLKLRREVLPPSGTYIDEIIVVGSTFSANFRRTCMAEQLTKNGVVCYNGDPKINIWAGQRASLKSEEEDFAGFLSSGNFNKEHDVFSDETDMALFVLNTLWGKTEFIDGQNRLYLPNPTRLYLPEPADAKNQGDKRFDKKPPLSRLGIRDYSQLVYYFENSGLQISVLNARAVERPQGGPRHTTASCAAEWLALNNPPLGYTILEINGNPHVYRINAEIQKVFATLGRSDINVIGAGIEARRDSPPSLFLGELARILYNNY